MLPERGAQDEVEVADDDSFRHVPPERGRIRPLQQRVPEGGVVPEPRSDAEPVVLRSQPSPVEGVGNSFPVVDPLRTKTAAATPRGKKPLVLFKRGELIEPPGGQILIQLPTLLRQ